MKLKPTIVLFDALIIVAVGIATFWFSAHFDILEWIVLQASTFENLEIDEIVFTLNVIALGLGVFFISALAGTFAGQKGH